MVGLDAAGKTTILYKLKLGEIVTTIPTIGKIARKCIFLSLTHCVSLCPCRIQCGDSRIQKHQLHSLGRRWPGQDQTPLETLLPEHPGTHLRRGQQRQVGSPTGRECGQTVNIPLVRERIGEARDELMRMLAEDELREAVLLIFANKQDLPNAMNAAEITDKLGLHSLRNRNWYIQVKTALRKFKLEISLHPTFCRQRVRHPGTACMRV